jgi:tyrosyl-DNA phosphodiesterase-1
MDADTNEVHRKQFDSDVRDLVKVKIIHGFWENDDKKRIALLV